MAALAVLLFVLCQFTCTMFDPYSSELGSQTKLQARNHPFHCVIKHAVNHSQNQIRVQRDFKVIPLAESFVNDTVCIFTQVQLIDELAHRFSKAITYKLWLIYCYLLI